MELFFSGEKFLVFVFYFNKKIKEVKGNVPNMYRQKKFSKLRSEFFFFFVYPLPAELSAKQGKVPHIFACLLASFLAVVGVDLLQKCLRRTVVFQH